MDVLTLDWVGFSHWPWIRRLSQVNWFGLHLYWGRGNNLESILLLISPVSDLSDSVSLLEDAGMQASNSSGSWGMGHSLICLRSPDPTIANVVIKQPVPSKHGFPMIMRGNV
jgi:hypothetical protein